jgi:hypothetical protein
MRNERVQKFFDSKEFTEQRKLPIDTAQSDDDSAQSDAQ